MVKSPKMRCSCSAKAKVAARSLNGRTPGFARIEPSLGGGDDRYFYQELKGYSLRLSYLLALRVSRSIGAERKRSVASWKDAAVNLSTA